MFSIHSMELEIVVFIPKTFVVKQHTWGGQSSGGQIGIGFPGEWFHSQRHLIKGTVSFVEWHLSVFL
uniref:Uncharacterized protein n=1 Tax=Octopus bimaculoides TaxID=37653 RepID=A0A0L8FQQ1_OCTBM